MSRWPLVLLLSSLSGCGLHDRPKIERKEQAKTPHLALENADRVVAPGIVEAWGGEVALSPQEPGTLTQLLVKEGELVEAGKTLAVLDDALQRAAVEVATADVAEAEAALAKALHGATPEDIRLARVELVAAETKSALARSQADRAHKLSDGGSIALADVERVDAEAQVASSAALAAKERLRALEVGTRTEDRAAARARLSAARARLDVANTSLARRSIVAPSAGTVLLSRFHVGERFELGVVPLFVLGDTSKLQIRLEVDEIDAFRVQPGDACTVYGDDGQPIAEASVLRLAPRMGRRTLTTESPTARADVRVREVFVTLAASSALVPGRRVWGHVRNARVLASHVD